MPTVTAILVGAGSGDRLGQPTPKAFAELAGEPLLVHAVRAFHRAETIDDIVVVVGSAQVGWARDLLDRAGLAVSAVCSGGRTRAESVDCGLDSSPDGAGLVAVHDVARALVSAGMIDRTVRALDEPWDAVAPALQVVDTLKLVRDEREVVRTVDRTGLWAVQTPQVFARLTLARALETARRGGGMASAPDDLSLVEQAGGRVGLVEGERRNLKITYPEDLAMATALLRDSGA